MRHQVIHLSFAIATLLGCSTNDPGQATASGGTGARASEAPSTGGASAPGDENSSPSRNGGT
ncbi:MAG TPA: hypothetical protein VKP30_29665, partial [Polyangiaceae bacterium]|nr:hypothetical protein [Polyangiaceae bacterium]